MNYETNYTKGFNTGYFVTKYEPILSEKLTLSLPVNNDFFQGFFAGKEQLIYEKETELLQTLNQMRQKDQQQEREL